MLDWDVEKLFETLTHCAAAALFSAGVSESLAKQKAFVGELEAVTAQMLCRWQELGYVRAGFTGGR